MNGEPFEPRPWPSQQQKVWCDTLALYYPDFYAYWADCYASVFERKRLDGREEAILLASLHSVLHSSPEIIAAQLERALDLGASVLEIIEALVQVGLREGQHTLSSGADVLWEVVQRRESEGRKVKVRGRVMTAEDLPPHAPWTPVRFPYQTPHPRPWRQLIAKYDPERTRIMDGATAAYAKLPAQMPRRLAELIDVSVDTTILWKAPQLDHHIHQALHCGAGVRELAEVVLVSAEAAQLAHESHISARRSASGVEIIHHGLQSLARVIGEREGAGMTVRMDHAGL